MTAALFKKCKPKPSNDIWIAATVKQHGLILVTRDKHFMRSKTLLLKNGDHSRDALQ
ncbi:PIN domain-containing protein [Mucilaginibacter flavidus]|uniref:PIN domain-containing protein n=1 Tax=Mucilaginibacter flavidus TaxID=2949309 RepID=UPI003511B683